MQNVAASLLLETIGDLRHAKACNEAARAMGAVAGKGVIGEYPFLCASGTEHRTIHRLSLGAKRFRIARLTIPLCNSGCRSNAL